MYPTKQLPIVGLHLHGEAQLSYICGLLDESSVMPGETKKAVMKEEMVINKRISDGMLGDRKREISGYTSVISGTALSFPMGRFIPASIIILT